MGRRPTKPGAIPRFRARKQKSGRMHYYYDHGFVDGKRREEPLGADYGLAIKRWAEIERESAPPAAAVLTFKHVADRYMVEVATRKADRTLADNRKEIARLLEFFNDPPGPLNAIEPVNVRQYMTWRTRGGTGLVGANREKALLSTSGTSRATRATPPCLTRARASRDSRRQVATCTWRTRSSKKCGSTRTKPYATLWIWLTCWASARRTCLA